MTDQTKPKKKPSGAWYRKQRRERERREHEARLELMKAQGRMVEAGTKRVTWKPRPHQKQLEAAHKRGIRRQAHVWHRRAGKSASCLDFLVRRAMERPGTYWYLTPKLTQTRTAIWESRRADGLKEIDVHIPADIRERTHQNEMVIELVNGSLIKFLGSDGFDRLVGANVHGIIFDEFALGDPAAWDYLAPILAADKESWAVFISTYRGRNHWYRMFQRVRDDAEWHTSFLTVDDTVSEDRSPIITPDRLDQERKEGKSEGYIQQEYYNDPLAAFEGAYYGAAMRIMQKEERLAACMYDPALPVTAAVDLGFADEMVFTFWQSYGNEERCIGSKAWKFTNLPDVLDDIKLTFPWGNRPMTAVIPHDGRFGAAELFETYGYEPVILPRTSSVAQEIERVRTFLGRVRIDNAVRTWTDNEENNARLTEALLGYRTARSNLDSAVYQRQPAHTWESHYADSVRYYVAYRADNPASGSWHPAPDYTQLDRIAATIT